MSTIWEQQLALIGGNRSNQPRRLVSILLAELRFSSITDVMADGLHVYLMDFLGKINAIADSIRQTYLEVQ